MARYLFIAKNSSHVYDAQWKPGSREGKGAAERKITRNEFRSLEERHETGSAVQVYSELPILAPFGWSRGPRRRAGLRGMCLGASVPVAK